MRIAVSSIGSKVRILKAARDAIDRAGGGTLIGIDADPGCVGRHFVDEFYTHYSEAEYDFLIPTRDGELGEVGKWGGFVSDNPEKYNDKFIFTSLCEVLEIPHPKTFYADEILEKPRYGFASEGVSIRKDMLFQELLPGPEYGGEAYVRKDGKVHGIVLWEKTKRAPNGEADIATVIDAPYLEKKLTAGLERFMGLRGPINMDIMAGKLLEINPRLGGTTDCAIAAGLDSIYWMILEHFGKPLPPFEKKLITLYQYRTAEVV